MLRSDRERRARVLWFAAAALALAMGAAAPATELAWAPALAAFLALPILVARRRPVGHGWLLWDLPALGFVAVFGWSGGLAGCIAWRIAAAAAGSGCMPPGMFWRYGAALALSLPAGAEAMVRAGYLGSAWSYESLGLASMDAAEPGLEEPSWTGIRTQRSKVEFTFIL